MRKLKAVFLDFGNTIVDEKPFIRGAQMGFVKFVKDKLSIACDEESLYAKLRSTPFPPPDDPMLREIKEREYYGRMRWGLNFAEACGMKIDSSTENEMMKAYDDGAKNSPCLIGDMKKTLGLLAEKYMLCIVSNGYSGFVYATLEHYDLKRFFSSIIVSQDVNIQKPQKEIYDLALKHCNIEPQEALMVGDGYIPDIWGSKIHGLSACWINPENKDFISSGNSLLSFLVASNYPEPTGKEHDFMIKRLDELPEIVSGIFKAC
ncbi:MAG: hypothetical protein A2017_17835 [Lentisphaerae bacterium GWF2_44_16]|nr:MAG: hypothetical protein A2017_17835 [Lentisphaerae bacterium GWF2_44_16]